MTNNYYNAGEVSRHTRARSTTRNSEFAAVEAGFDKLADPGPLNEGRSYYAADSGVADAYVITLSPAPTAYTAGMAIAFKAGNANTGSCTVNVNALGARALKQGDGSNPGAGDIAAGAIVEARYDGTDFIITSQDIGAQSAMEALYDSFDDRYLGSKSSNPATDNDGDALIAGAIYWNTTVGEFRVWNGSSWQSMAYNSSNVAITGGTINGITDLIVKAAFPALYLTNTNDDESGGIAYGGAGILTIRTDDAAGWNNVRFQTDLDSDVDEVDVVYNGGTPYRFLHLGYLAEVALSDAATIAWDMHEVVNGTVTLGGNRTLGNPTNAKSGQSGYLRIVQDGTGNRTLAYGANWEFEGGTPPTLSTAAGAEDMLEYRVISATRIFARLTKNIG